MRIPLALVIIIFLASCGGQSNYEYRAPENTNDGLTTGSLTEVGMDSVLIETLISRIQEGYLDYIDGILVVKNNKLVLEEYFNDYNRDKKHHIQSCTKSVAAALIGIAIDKGFIKSENDSLVTYLGPYRGLHDDHIDSIKIAQVLGMSTGYLWTGDFSPIGRKLVRSEDMVEFALTLPIDTMPGTRFTYSSANSLLLAPIIFYATGKQAHEFGEEQLLSRLGITNYEWHRQSEFWAKTVIRSEDFKMPEIEYDSVYAKLTNTASGLLMTPRDMLKFGLLYHHKGIWNDQQVIPASWVEKSLREQIAKSDYGLGWRFYDLGKYQSFQSTGLGLQRIILLPQLDMVVVLTQSWYVDAGTGTDQMNKILVDYIIRSIDEKNP